MRKKITNGTANDYKIISNASHGDYLNLEKFKSDSSQFTVSALDADLNWGTMLACFHPLDNNEY